MSDSDRTGADAPRPSLETLALAEALARIRAAGETSSLSQALATLNAAPDAAVGAVADALMANVVNSDDDSDGVDVADSDERADALSPGTQRALAAIFGTGNAPTHYDVADEDGADEDEHDALALVAETSAAYETRQAAPGLLDLARSRRLDAESLAARLMLTPEALRWLDRVALPPERQPEALVAHLVGALGVDRARVGAALAAGEPLTGEDAASLIDLLARNGTLSVLERSYWDALLSSSA